MKLRTAILVCAALSLALTAAADDGLWTPQQVPSLAPELQKLGLKIDPSQFNDLTGFPMGAIVSLGGCSASFVSPQGLIATNHHCVFGALQYNSTPEKDLIRNGFLARTRPEEIRASPDARVYVTTGIEDVTATILAPFAKKATDADRWKTITRRRRQMIEACEKPGGLRCQVASFYEGAQYVKITQLEIRDVRLVYAPAEGIGNYGDETDNWMWPRHTGDFGFYRAYVGRDGKAADYSADNVPYEPKHFLKISTRDLDPGDLVLVTGFPGRTTRHALAEEVADAQDFEMPTSIRYREMLLDVLHARGANDRAIALKNANRIAGLENILKKYRGSLEAFRRDGIVAAKQKESAATDAAVAADPVLAKKYAAAKAELAAILAAERATRERDTLLAWLYTSSPMLSQANTLYRLSVQKTKDDLDRAEDYTERNRNRLKGSVARARRSMEPGTDRAGLRLFLLETAKLPASQRIKSVDDALAATGKATAEEQVDAFLDRLYAGTKIGDAAVEDAMFGETTAQLLARHDAMIDFAASLRTLGDANDEADAMRRGAMSRLRPVMLDALRLQRGGRLYPDANGTLRVGFGTVEGYSPRDATVYAPQTTVTGVVQKNTGEVPFDSPKRLLELAAAKSFGSYTDPDLGDLPVAFISTNVVTNGSSGSATLNAWGELCGLAFDVNWEGVGGDFVVNPDITRTIHVDSRYILWVMDAVDGATNLLQELNVKPQFAR